MTGPTVGTAYVQIIPSAKGIKGNIENLFAGEAKEAGEKLGSSLGTGIGKKLKTTLIAGSTAIVGAVAAVGKEAVSSYADYEQLVGGVETLFKDSAPTIQKYADDAYKTAGLSANEYMETVTSFSASLIKSMGGDTEAAAKLADVAITDMADNANKMGSDMGSIQNAYNGFAKQNYTMLDNLKLGYGGTKEEMQRLIDDANALNAAQGNMTRYSIDSYADIVSAIHDVQTEMGITGTTAQEASSTISGSVSSAKSAWKNWLTELGKDSGDVKGKTDELIASITQVIQNIIPIAKEVLKSLGEAMLEGGKNLVIKLGQGIANGKINRSFDMGNNPMGSHSFAKGLDYVPYDEFPAILHKGEAVLTAEEARGWRAGSPEGASVITINQSIQAVPQTPAQIAAATAAAFELARWTV